MGWQSRFKALKRALKAEGELEIHDVAKFQMRDLDDDGHPRWARHLRLCADRQDLALELRGGKVGRRQRLWRARLNEAWHLADATRRRFLNWRRKRRYDREQEVLRAEAARKGTPHQAEQASN